MVPAHMKLAVRHISTADRGGEEVSELAPAPGTQRAAGISRRQRRLRLTWRCRVPGTAGYISGRNAEVGRFVLSFTQVVQNGLVESLSAYVSNVTDYYRCFEEEVNAVIITGSNRLHYNLMAYSLQHFINIM